MSSLEKKLERLQHQEVRPELIAALRDLVTAAPPPALLKIAPPRLAERWGLPADEVLDAFLLATREGIFDLEWDVRCPSCVGSTQLVHHLKLLASRSSCAYCRLDIKAGFDDAVEVTFRVNANVRDLGEVQTLDVIRHRIEMEPPRVVNVAAGAREELTHELVGGSWHLFTAEFCAGAPLWVRGEASEEGEPPWPVDYVYDGKALTRADTDPRRPGPALLTVENRGEGPLELFLARAKPAPWLSGAQVASNQRFRDLFTAELLDPEEAFGIKSLSFVFTDVKGSTAMYERLGDSKAYALIREHFRIMKDVIQRRRGAIVKTIGDAVMATFLVSQDAMDAVFEMQRAFTEFNAREQTTEEIVIKVGAHGGPCIAVNSNDRVDYFGRTVNVAARVQSLSEGGDIVLSRTLAEEPAVRRAIEASGWRSRAAQAQLKGIEGDYEVVALTPGAGAAA